MIAALPMYDFGDLPAANDQFWALIRDGLRAQGQDAPEALTHGAPDLWPVWQSPALVLAQTCGYPYRARLHGKVTLVATPDYGLPGCPPGHYCSVYIARIGDPRGDLAEFDGAGFAYNEPLSQSGWAAPTTHAAGLGLSLRPVLKTGAHRASALAVAEGRADLAALDAVTWRHLERLDPVAARLRVVGRTPPTPGLPLICAAGVDAAALRGALAEAVAGLPDGPRLVLGLRGIVEIPASAYLAVPNPPPPEALT
ncbi:MAG: phosphate/phosphite/phosphonate ABC transporter substrate-binding protein [Pseudorhodobacter sp.]